jgi:hypothetical protein
MNVVRDVSIAQYFAVRWCSVTCTFTWFILVWLLSLGVPWK